MLQQNRPLTGQFSDYLTDVDESWERLPPDYQAHLDQNMPELYETVDKDENYQKGYMSGHKSGILAGIHIMERQYEQHND